MEIDQKTLLPSEIAKTIVDPRAYADNRIHDAYAWLRKNNPLGIAAAEGFDPFWVVTKHIDIMAVGRNSELFHNGDLPATLTDQQSDALSREMTGGSPHLVKSLVQMDPPEHRQYRALTQGFFMHAKLRSFEPRVRELAKQAVDRLAQHGGRCDFVSDLALMYPLRVIMEILGVPEEDEPRMLTLTQELFGPQDPDTARVVLTDSDRSQYAKNLNSVLEDFYQYFDAISSDRRANPRDDLASVIANATINGEPLPRFEELSYYVIVATAGHDTTSSSTSHAIWALCDDPEQFMKVKKNPSLIPSLVEEAIRWATPVKHFMRSATADTELRGRRIRKGDWLMLCYASGNRDEEVFEEPFSFRVDRNPNKHIAFGHGAHVCLGQHLARMEMRILFEELIPRLKWIEHDGTAAMTESFFVSGPKRLPVRFEID